MYAPQGPPIQTLISLNYIIRLCLLGMALSFCILLPFRLDNLVIAPWVLVFIPLYACLFLWTIYVLDSFRRYLKTRSDDFKFRTYNTLYHLIYMFSIIGLTAFLVLVTRSLDLGDTSAQQSQLIPLIVCSGLSFLCALVMFLLSILDFGSVTPIGERIQAALVSRTGYIMFMSLMVFAFSLALYSRLQENIPLSFWNVFGIFWFLFGVSAILLIWLSWSLYRKRSNRRLKQILHAISEEAAMGPGSGHDGPALGLQPQEVHRSSASAAVSDKPVSGRPSPPAMSPSSPSQSTSPRSDFVRPVTSGVVDVESPIHPVAPSASSSSASSSSSSSSTAPPSVVRSAAPAGPSSARARVSSDAVPPTSQEDRTAVRPSTAPLTLQQLRLSLADQLGALEVLDEDDRINEFKKYRRRECLTLSFLVWLPLLLFLLFLSAQLDNSLSWTWIEVFAPIIFLLTLLLCWALNNSGHRVAFDVVVDETVF